MSDTRFSAAMTFLIKWEGTKFTNDPVDRGGATRYGVTQRVYDAFRKRKGLSLRTVRDIDYPAEVAEIYRRSYWASVEGDRLPVPLDIVAFDTAVLMGPDRAVRFLQASVGAGVDGQIGTQTRNAIAHANAMAAAKKYLQLREDRLRAIVAANPSQNRFLKGWMNRLNDLRRTVGIAVPESSEDDSVGNGSDDANPEEIPGRADMDLPGDEGPDDAATSAPAGSLALFQSMGVGEFVQSLRSLSADGIPLTIDPTATTEENLAVIGTNGRGYGLPVALVESVTLRGLDPSGRAQVLLALHPEFSGLAGLLTGGGGATSSPTSGEDEDPAGDGSHDAESEARANFGDEAGSEAESFAESAESFPFPTLPIDFAKVEAFLSACIHSSPRVSYGLGSKVPRHGAVPGRDFRQVDCSGWVREAIWRATGRDFPDGSVVQHEWVIRQGFKRSTVDAGALRDGAVRIAFLPPIPHVRVGHVVLLRNGMTFESHGGLGPDSRVWANLGWRTACAVYVLTPPTGA